MKYLFIKGRGNKYYSIIFIADYDDMANMIANEYNMMELQDA